MVDGFLVSIAFLIWFVIFFGVYFIAAYILWRVGRKFGVGSYLQYLIPIWNVFLLCDCAKITRWVTVAVVAPGLVLWPLAKLGISITLPFFENAAAFVTYLGTAYIWGNIAGRFGKNPWLWGILTPILFFIPALILAFGDSMPFEGGPKGQGGRYIDV